MFGLFKFMRRRAEDKARYAALVQADIEARTKYEVASARLTEALSVLKRSEGMDVCTIDSDGLMKVEVNGAIHRRPAQEVVFERGDMGLPMRHCTPELREGEVLIETIGSNIPKIIRTGL
ncbi:hypothetical protein CLU93_5427 [Janthinobacterium sp. 35]|uniref:hypothetical protein n=1 Tax=Janthinobacterium sp. 35 TaxID=2035210 RepID=UPI000C385162|nr:hypothetical protein [Janthinobacterium sp. 35]PIG31075.1 hypothetical protein CLU93_5427 [Janthinobacterium sp. 35]